MRRLRLPRHRIALAVAAVLVLAGTLLLLAGLTAGRGGAAALHPVAAAPTTPAGPRAEARGAPSPSPVARYTPSSDVRWSSPRSAWTCRCSR